MDTRKTIRKIMFVSMWMVICSGMLMLLIAAMGNQKKDTCKGYKISIKGERAANFFYDEQAISKFLKAAAKGNITGQSRASLNLLQMEQMLEKNVWIKDAQLYFDNKSILRVSVEEREPVARIFTAGGRSFYLDNTGQTMPLSEKAITKVPVFTGFPDKKVFSKTDSVLLNDINTTAAYITGNAFWASQVAQIDINGDCGPGCWQFEMVPVVGQHIVKLGTGEDIQKKFERLYTFYQQVLNKKGLDHYKIIDVRFNGQVVGAKSDNPKVDSVKSIRKIEEMMRHAEEMAKEDVTDDTPSNPKDQQVPKAVMTKRN